MKILIVEDDKILSESLRDYLSGNDHNVDVLNDFEDEHFFELGHFDLILLDLMLKGKKGENILKNIRKKGFQTPIIVITAKEDLNSKETCFTAGADDYIVKPFNPKELLLRINAVSKRMLCNDLLKIGEVLVDIKNKIVLKGETEIFLTRTEWDLLFILIKNRGSVVSTEKIMCYVWGDKPVGSESIRTYVKNLRKFLPEDAIVTYKCRGYMLR